MEDGCTFCEPFKNIKDLTIAKLLSNVKPPMLELGGVKMPLPFRLVGLPTLVDGEKIYVGRGPVQDRLEQTRNGK